jgi:hypothetical protein
VGQAGRSTPRVDCVERYLGAELLVVEGDPTGVEVRDHTVEIDSKAKRHGE